MKSTLYCKRLNNNPKAVEIGNGQLIIDFNNRGMADSLIFKGRQLLKNLTGEPADPDKNHSFYCDYHMDGKTINLLPDKLKIIEQSKKLVHIAYIDNKSKLGLEYHIIMKANDPGIYSYVKAWNNVHHSFDINELRTVYRLDRSLVPIGYNGVRTGLQPASKHMMKGKKLQDETFLMQDGSLYDSSFVYSKYDYAGYFKDTNFWGQYGNDVGLWVIVPNKSFYGCGPLNQDLMIHYDAITLNYLVSEHFGKGLFTIKPNFSKIFGPWYVYLNNGNIDDTKKRAKKEEEAWPYNWVNEPDYPTKLFELKGKIQTEYRHKNCTIILTNDSIDRVPLDEQKNGYVYYTNSDEKGNFRLSKVRSGCYYLYIYENYSDDLITHFIRKLKINSNLNLGLIIIKRRQKTIWQIGECTHTTLGMKFSDQLRNYCWMNLVPANIDYFVHQSQDWYYLQNDSGKWNIHFKKDDLSFDGKDYELQISLAGATQKDMHDKNGCTMNIVLNGKQKFTKSFGNDRAAYRSALLSGRHHLWRIKIPAKDLLNNNILTFTTNGYLLYDTICLMKALNA